MLPASAAPDALYALAVRGEPAKVAASVRTPARYGKEILITTSAT
jgi:hypothetical protein